MRRPSSWIHRFSRPLIGAFAALGMANTGYLTSVKLSGGGVACSSADCSVVLDSAYASVFGIPLSLLGLLAYLAVAVLAIAPFLVSAQAQKKLHNQVQDWTWLGMLLAGSAMVVFSGYLMFLLAAVIKAPCPYCIASAVFSLAIFVLAWIGKEWDDLGSLLTPVVMAFVLTALVSLGLYASVNDSISAENGEITTLSPVGARIDGQGWTLTSKSGPSELALAEHLKKTGAVMYSAWFCSHCFEQKQLFGQEAVKAVLPFVECNEQGENPQVALCQKQGITSYPTWEIQGKKYLGVRLPEELAKLSGYQGIQEFKYSKLWQR
jgi:uncharacterized membrane protein/glutaredoxin